MGTIAQELTRIQTAKTDIKTSIEAKGVQVPSNALISTYDTYIDQIQTGTTPVLTTLNVNTNGTYTPTAGVDGYDEVNVNVPSIQPNNFTDATDLFYSGRLLDIADKLLPSFTGTMLYEAFGMTSSGPTIQTAHDWCKKAAENAGPNDLFSMQLMMSYNTTYANDKFTLDLSDVVLTNNNVLFSIASFCTGAGRTIKELELNFDNSAVSPHKLIGLSVYLGNSQFRKLSIRCWVNGGNITPAAVGYNSGFTLLVYKNNNPDATTTIFTNSYGTSDVPLQTVTDSIPYYQGNLGPVVWRLPSGTYSQLTQTMIDEAAQYNLTFTT